MSDLREQTVFISGASSGIGKACAEIFAEQGARLILSARRSEKLKELSDDLARNFGHHPLTLALDVRERAEVERIIAELPREWSDIDILINNAGLARGMETVQQGKVESWEEMIDTNIKGLLYLTRCILPGMVRRNKGHIINLGSVAGRDEYPGGNVYCATKAAVHMLCEAMKRDLLGTKIRVSLVAPGRVRTEFNLVRSYGDLKANEIYDQITPLEARDIADTVLYCATRPAHVNISEIFVLPVDQAGVSFAR